VIARLDEAARCLSASRVGKYSFASNPPGRQFVAAIDNRCHSPMCDWVALLCEPNPSTSTGSMMACASGSYRCHCCLGKSRLGSSAQQNNALV
jgi:hypothetical protein